LFTRPELAAASAFILLGCELVDSVLSPAGHLQANVAPAIASMALDVGHRDSEVRDLDRIFVPQG
jgi:hypothetical protein